MKVLLVKTSSLGDVIHALPAVTEAAQNVPNMELTWVVEEGFADIPARHPAVKRVVPVALRRWRRNWIGAQQEVGGFLRDLRGETYDLVLDSQGLLKSAVIALVARGPVAGYDRHSAREGLAAAFYQQHAPVDRRLHAVMRQKQLFAA
ncbi:MAG: lipopolysaccharide heptosyltransferase I, partial [Pseudomonadales bacterium]